MSQKIIGRFIIEIAGKPEKNVSKALNVVLEKIKADKNHFKLLDFHIEEPILDKKTTLYAGFLEVNIEFKESLNVLSFVLDYTPTSIEIEEPSTIKIDSNDFTAILNDMSSNILANVNNIRKLNAYVHMQNKRLDELEGGKKE